MLTVCCECKVMQRLDKVWEPITELAAWFAREYPDKVSHGYCDNCADELLKEAVLFVDTIAV